MTRPTQATVTGRFIGGGLFKARANPQDPERERYSACVVLDAGQDALVEKAIRQAIAEKWGEKPPAGLQNWGIREGDDPEYTSSFQKKFINPKTSRPVDVLVKNGSTYVKTTQEDGVVYPGCYVAASVEAYAYEGDKKKGVKPGVTLNLRAVLFRKDGERLDDHMDAESEFGAVDVPADEDDFLAA